MKNETKIAMQEKCIYCGEEQYKPAVWSISNGEHPCVWCGKVPPIMTVAEYKQELSKFYLSNPPVMRQFYCQRDIEMEAKCDEQCEHCKEYYAPLEGNKIAP